MEKIASRSFSSHRYYLGETLCDTVCILQIFLNPHPSQNKQTQVALLH